MHVRIGYAPDNGGLLDVEINAKPATYAPDVADDLQRRALDLYREALHITYTIDVTVESDDQA